jgi:hypothetical protein
MKLIDRYNQFYNQECAGLPHGMPISMEQLQAISLESMCKAFARKYNLRESIPVEDILNLAEQLHKQGNKNNGLN